MKKKIGLFLDSAPRNGGKHQYSQSLLEAAANLPKDKFTLVVACFFEDWRSHLAEYDVQTIFVSVKFWKWFFDRIWRNLHIPIGLWRKVCPSFVPLSRMLIAENCDLWIFPTESTLVYQLAVPSIVTIFDLMHRYEAGFPEVSAYGRNKRRDRHYSNLCKYSKGILVDSEIGKQQVVESYGFEEKRIYVLPYVAPKYIYSQLRKDVCLPYTLPSKFIFYPAQFWEHKNHKRLIEATKLLKHQLPDLKLVLAGSKKNAYESVPKLVQDLNLAEDVKFLGYVSDEEMPEIYRRARALVMPTFFGPTNIPPLEAFAVGCPVAVSNIYGMAEQTGDAALLFDPTSVDDIATAIHRLWTDDGLCRFLAAKGRERAAAWGPAQFSEKLGAILCHVLRDRY